MALGMIEGRIEADLYESHIQTIVSCSSRPEGFEVQCGPTSF